MPYACICRFWIDPTSGDEEIKIIKLASESAADVPEEHVNINRDIFLTRASFKTFGDRAIHAEDLFTQR